MCPKPTYLTIFEDDLEKLKEIGDYFIKTNDIKKFPKDKQTPYMQFRLAIMYAEFYIKEKKIGI